MDRSRVESIVVRRLPELSRTLGLSQWDISLGYNSESSRDDGTLKKGECNRLIDYQSAHITLNPEAFGDEDAVLRTLRHELFHIVLAPFDLYTSAVAEIELPEVATDLLERVQGHAIERAVAGLERMWEGLLPAYPEPRSIRALICSRRGVEDALKITSLRH